MNIVMPQASALLLCAALLLANCASFVIPDTEPLTAEQLNPPGSKTISAGGYRLDALAPTPDAPDLLVLVAFSGGGKRSSAYSFGVLKGMREVMVPTRVGPRPLLDQVDGISGISGGSFTAAYYGLHREATFGRFGEDFLYLNTNAYVWGIYLLPWNWGWLFDPTLGTNDFMARVYDRTMYHGARFAALAQRGRPLIAIGATEISSGAPFVFGQDTFDLICSDVEKFSVARAVAASAAFPGLFSPITLTNRAAACGGRAPAWLRRVTPEERVDPLSRIGAQATLAERYLDPERMRFVHLADGGISDNLGLRSAGSMMQNLAQSPEALAARGFDRLRRILVISVDGQAAQDESVAQQQVVGGLFRLFGLVSGAQISRYGFETLITVDQQLRDITQAIRAARCGRGPVIDGAPCGDVEASLVRISLADLPEGPRRTQLLSIPTTLTLSRENVDMLIEAGQNGVMDSTPLLQFLQDYPRRAPDRAARVSESRRVPGPGRAGGGG
jgi:NTE family protein